jgi:hypothetical protein
MTTTKAGTKGEKATKVKAPRTAADTRAWATFGVVFMLVLSAILNGYANAQHAPVALLGWMMGLAVPVIVLVLSKVAGEQYHAAKMGVAWLAGAPAVGILFLSVYHCSASIALLTGSTLVLAVPMAIAIDVGLIACEVALITEKRRK